MFFSAVDKLYYFAMFCASAGLLRALKGHLRRRAAVVFCDIGIKAGRAGTPAGMICGGFGTMPAGKAGKTGRGYAAGKRTSAGGDLRYI